MFRLLAKRVLRLFGLDAVFSHGVLQVWRKSPPPRSSFVGVVENLVHNGFAPRTVIDVGAANGTPPLQFGFPTAFHVLVEPLEEFATALQTHASHLDHALVVMAGAGPNDGKVRIHVHPDLVGSSMYLEAEEGTDVNGVERTVPQVRLDSLDELHGFVGPVLLKANVQGYELAVLEGASAVLGKTEVVILETSLFPFFDGGPTLDEVTEHMRRLGFAPYDVFNRQYRPIDGALSQVDVVFVRSDSLLRAQHGYATPEQRQAQDRRIRRRIGD